MTWQPEEACTIEWLSPWYRVVPLWYTLQGWCDEDMPFNLQMSHNRACLIFLFNDVNDLKVFLALTEEFDLVIVPREEIRPNFVWFCGLQNSKELWWRLGECFIFWWGVWSWHPEPWLAGAKPPRGHFWSKLRRIDVNQFVLSVIGKIQRNIEGKFYIEGRIKECEKLWLKEAW
jgi:hypothetical protein